jgi:thiamine biosynthesis lipoprotein
MTDFEHHEECMGTVFVFQGRSELSDVELAEHIRKACEKLHEADEIFSLYKPGSPLSQLARGETSVANCPPAVDAVWNLCEQWEKITDGYFSPFTPERTFDPSGIVKTWAAQQAIDVLLNAGITDFSLNSGGDIWLSDSLSGEDDWKVGVAKPVTIASEEAGVLTAVNLQNTPFRAVATSGSAERGTHIWNPRAGAMAQSDLVQVTVLAADLVMADVWATAAYAEGPNAIDRISKQDGVEALFVFSDGRIDGTDGFAEVLKNSI